MGNAIYLRRKAINVLMLTLAMGATAIGLMWLLLVLGMLVVNGASAISLELFTSMTPPPGSEGGGLLNAIFGSIVMSILAMAMGLPIGLFAGTWLAEYGRKHAVAETIRFVNEVQRREPRHGSQAHLLSGLRPRGDGF